MFNKKAHALLAVLLCVSLFATGCSSDWIAVALDDLPVLTEMALNIGTLATTLESGKQLSATETAEIQNISTQASKDLNVLQALYNEYKQNPNSGTLQKIQNAISDINRNLPALLQAVHVSNAALSARVSAAVNLILVTVNSFALLIPGTSGQGNLKEANLPHPADLKKQWNHQICGAMEVSINAACTLQR